ncbi:M20 family metallopeptidase [Streptomyces rhizosphaericus]|uniref:M20 family metallopeptidase n=1 Tax=Streptomyces rhizosphaericus TaxID=114699 RepID=A0A6G4A948_9ACTN|nr:M20 family metallopeptidase [Streptomyces rhizosphaericus]NEW69916.1 M20 family metallopeptidase [Streptomyces rhizosphaericus]
MNLDCEVASLAQRLVRAPSENPPGREAAAAEVLAEQATRWGLQVTGSEVAKGRTNVVIRLPGAGSAPSLVYCGHLDTVPCGDREWEVDPLSGVVRDGHLWGRGAVDMKGGLAAMLTSLAVLGGGDTRLPGDVVLAAVVGEEVDCAGSRHLSNTEIIDDAGWLVVGEPTGLDLVIAHKGAIRIELTVHGKAAHGAAPELGMNAIIAMARLLSALEIFPPTAQRHPLLGSPTASLNTIKGGTAINVVPDSCRAVLDVRTIPGAETDDILEAINETADHVRAVMPGIGVEAKILHERASVSTPPDHQLVRAAQHAASRTLGSHRPMRGAAYFSDASVLSPPRNLPTILFGPGEESFMHRPNERVSLTALSKAARFFATLPTSLFSLDLS